METNVDDSDDTPIATRWEWVWAVSFSVIGGHSSLG